jgi:hypothetical protein
MAKTPRKKPIAKESAPPVQAESHFIAVPKHVLSSLVSSHAYLAGQHAKTLSQTKTQVTDEPGVSPTTGSPCNCPNPCANSWGGILICSGGNVTVLANPAANSTLNFDASLGSIYWSTV